MWQLYTGLVDCFGRCEVVRFLVINLGFIYTVVWLVMVGVAMVFVWTCASIDCYGEFWWRGTYIYFKDRKLFRFFGLEQYLFYSFMGIRQHLSRISRGFPPGFWWATLDVLFSIFSWLFFHALIYLDFRILKLFRVYTNISSEKNMISFRKLLHRFSYMHQENRKKKCPKINVLALLT